MPYQVFEVADGHLILAVGNDGQFRKFCEVAGCAELASDTRFAHNADRVRHRETLVPLLAERLKRRRKDEWLAALEAEKVPCGAINSLNDVFADPQVLARGMTSTVPHPLNAELKLVSSPMKLSATPVTLRHAPPMLGQHTMEVLGESGLSADEINTLREQGII